MSTMDIEILQSMYEKFYSEYTENIDCNWHSYDRCRISFLNASEECSELAELNLYAYLANWGMMRNSFLSNRVYIDRSDSDGLISELIKYRSAKVENLLFDDIPNYQYIWGCGQNPGHFNA